MAELHILVEPLMAILGGLWVHGVVFAVAWGARGALRAFGMGVAVLGLLAMGAYVVIAWQTSAYLDGRAETFPGMTAYNWSALTAMGALVASGVVAYALHRSGHSLPRWRRRR